MSRLLAVALLLWVSPLAQAKPSKLAAKHCEPALENAVQFESAPALSPASVDLCRQWYGESATEAELEALVCMAEAPDRAAWEACRAPFAPVSAKRKVTLDVRRRELDREIDESAGVLGALRDGSDLEGGIGGLIGARGVQHGSGLGGLGTRGSTGSADGSGGGHFGSEGPGDQVVVGGECIILGELEQSAIDEVVKRHLNQIRYCYQRELTKHPKLSGELVVKFVIAKDGTVSSARTKSSTLGSSAVEHCVNGRFMRFQFPEPPGGGIVIVSCPIEFAPGAREE